MNDPYAIHRAIARNATISFDEPADFEDMSKGSITISKTCSEIILLGIEYEQHIFAERGYPEDKERQSSDSMILDYIAVNWAHIEPIKRDHLAEWEAITGKKMTEEMFFKESAKIFFGEINSPPVESTQQAYISEADTVWCDECWEAAQEDNIGDQNPNHRLFTKQPWHPNHVCEGCGCKDGKSLLWS